MSMYYYYYYYHCCYYYYIICIYIYTHIYIHVYIVYIYIYIHGQDGGCCPGKFVLTAQGQCFMHFGMSSDCPASEICFQNTKP